MRTTIIGNTKNIDRDLFLKHMVQIRKLYGVTVDIEW